MDTTLFGGDSFRVLLRDGRVEEVFVRQLPLKDFPSLLFLVNVARDEGAVLAFVCKKSEDWVETLSPESHEALLETVKEVNCALFDSMPNAVRSATAAAEGNPYTLTELVAEICVAVGITREQALNESLAWLRALLAGIERRDANAGLINLQTTSGAVASCWTKEGGRYASDLSKELIKRRFPPRDSRPTKRHRNQCR